MVGVRKLSNKGFIYTNKKPENVAINGIRVVVIPTKCKTENTIMNYKRVNDNSLVCSTQDCIILLPFQLKTKTAKSALYIG